MILDKIISLANSKVQQRFLAMERSLRKTGCNLPLWVIPYDEDRFDLPENAIWWEIPEITGWLKNYRAHPTMRKYQCLTVGNYQFVDADVIFLSNPEETLRNMNGFVTSCGHWNNPGHTYTKESLAFLKSKSSLWQKYTFNTGQFACDQPLYDFPELKTKAESEGFKNTCLTFPFHEQPGVNLLVNASPVTITNLTLPPHNMESTWAGDYPEKNYSVKWTNQNKPYLIHWAGCLMNVNRPIDELFLSHLTEKEKEKWNKDLQMKSRKTGKAYLKRLFKKLKDVYLVLKA